MVPMFFCIFNKTAFFCFVLFIIYSGMLWVSLRTWPSGSNQTGDAETKHLTLNFNAGNAPQLPITPILSTTGDVVDSVWKLTRCSPGEELNSNLYALANHSVNMN